MSGGTLRSYRFATKAQWEACLLARVDRGETSQSGVLRPFAAYAQPAALFASEGAHSPVITRAGEILWRDDAGALYRMMPDDDQPEKTSSGSGAARGTRTVATANRLWVIGTPPDAIQAYDDETLTRVLTVDVKGRVVDIAESAHDSIAALVRRGREWAVIRVDSTGRIASTIALHGLEAASAFVHLRRSKQFVVFGGHAQRRLYWFPRDGGAASFSLAIGAMRPCFTSFVTDCPPRRHVLGSDGRERVFLAGKDGDDFGGGAHVLVFDADGNAIGDVPLDALDQPATGIAASRDRLFVTGQRGLLRFTSAATVPETASPVQCTVITPVLHSPDREDRRRWLRVEASVDLPEGSTIEISYAATDSEVERDRLKAIAEDRSQSQSKRIASFSSEPGLWRGRVEMHGAGRLLQDPPPLAAKLFDVSERFLWVCVTLTAAPGAQLPSLSELAVLYPGRTLMENLPAIYQREEERPGSFLRSLVGVLEATTQEIDGRIASMGSHVHPATAPEPWLDFIARWLGVPWDDGLTAEQKREIVRRAPDLAKWRGTRAGLEALLESLVPGSPRRFRVIDATADFGFATVGGSACSGSALPALLGGRTRWSPELDSNAVLGYMRLPCDGQRDDGTAGLAGRIRVDVAATAAERRAWEPVLKALIAEMVPLTARVELRWISAHALRGDRLDGTWTLAPAPTAHLGNDAITNVARLSDRGRRTSASGPSLSTRLR